MDGRGVCNDMARVVEDLCSELMELPLGMKVKEYKLKTYDGVLSIETNCSLTVCGQVLRSRKIFQAVAGLIHEVGIAEDRNREEAIEKLRQAYRLCKEGFSEA